MYLPLRFKRQINDLSSLSVNTIRILSIEMIAQAKSGHPGIALGAAPIIYTLFHDHFNYNPKDFSYFNRDRFILSAGHASSMLYATMLISGYASLTMDDLKKFRQLNSLTPGHPENHVLHGVEIGTGPLGQGIAMAVGFAIAEARLAAKFNKYSNFINHHTYVLFGDGDLEEGVAQEAIALAGKNKLKKLIMFYDSNKVQLDGKVTDSTNYNVRKLFKAYDWNYIRVRNGNNTARISAAIARAKRSSKPTVIECNTIIGYGSRFQNTNAVHGAPLNQDQINEVREFLNYKIPSFVVHPSVYEDMKILAKRGVKAQQNFNIGLQKLENKSLKLYNEYIQISANKFNFDLNWYNTYQAKPDMPTRTLMSDILQPFVQNNETVMVGSADLISSTQVTNKNAISFSRNTREGNNINYGVREFAMCCINNGITIHGGCRSIDSTFLVFSDYCKSAIRLAGISHIPSINIFSHDTITVGEDGPTHQPIEQIPSLRLIPNHYVFRPANKSECIVALNHAVNMIDAPTTIITSRGNFKQYDSSYEDAKYGGYVIKNIDNHEINLIATGSEVAVAIEVSEALAQQNIKARVISMNCIKLFASQGQNYQDSILDHKPTVSIEFASTSPWYKYVDLAIGIDQFGKSGKPNDLVDYFDLSTEKITNRISLWYKSLTHQGE